VKRKSFIIHIDALDVLNELTDTQAGQLLRAIASYHKGDKYPLDGLMNAVFIPFKNQFDRDDVAYQAICERNRNNGLYGGRPKTQKTQSDSLGSSGNPDKPKKPDNDSDNDNKSESDNKEILPPFVPKDAWASYCKHRGRKFSSKAKELALKKLSKWHQEGEDIEEILNNSVMNGWTGIYKKDEKRKGTTNGKSKSQLADEAIARAIAREEAQPENNRPSDTSELRYISDLRQVT